MTTSTLRHSKTHHAAAERARIRMIGRRRTMVFEMILFGVNRLQNPGDPPLVNTDGAIIHSCRKFEDRDTDRVLVKISISRLRDFTVSKGYRLVSNEVTA